MKSLHKRTVCVLCGKYGHEKTFGMPSCEAKRERWIASCGVALSSGSRVCALHFQKGDFINDLSSKRVRLQPGAVPMPRISVNRNPLDMVAQPLPSPARIKAQSKASKNDEFYASLERNSTTKRLPPSLMAPLAKRRNLTIKTVTPKNPISLINEELFDTTDEAMVVNKERPDVRNDIAQLLRDYQQPSDDSPKHSYISTGAQTDSSISRTCGYIESSPDDNIYSMNCFHCGEKFPIWGWSKFVAHVKENHQNLEDSFTNTDDLYNDGTYIEKQNDGFILKSVDNSMPSQMSYGRINEVFIVENKDNSLCKEEQHMDIETDTIKEETIEDVDVPEETNLNEYSTYHASSDSEFALSDAEDEVVPKRKGMVTRSTKASATNSTFVDTGKILTSDYLSSQEEEDEDNYSTSPIYDEIRFGRTHPTIVMDFLDVFQAQPVLWSTERTPKAAYTYVVGEVTEKFNKKWGTTIKVMNMRKSISRIKEWYRRSKTQKKEKPNLNIKFADYFDKCAEFLPYVEPALPRPPSTVKCDICNRRLLSEIHVQVHKFVRHKVGELPYKCGHCPERFSRKEKLEQHERKHTKVRSFICTVCKKGFYQECTLTTHMLTHNEDHNKICQVCGKKFPMPSRLRAHMVFHRPPQYKCDICSRQYYRKHRFEQHFKLHRNERDHICEECGKTFLRRKGLLEHKKTVHLEANAYHCNICNAEFRNFGALLNHRRSRHVVLEGTIEELEKATKKGNEKGYKCPICGHAFSCVANLHSHQKVKHLVLEGTIEELSKSKTKVYNRHKYVIEPVSNLRCVVCDICGNTYRRVGGLLVHKVNVHGYVRAKYLNGKSETKTNKKEAGDGAVVKNEVGDNEDGDDEDVDGDVKDEDDDEDGDGDVKDEDNDEDGDNDEGANDDEDDDEDGDNDEGANGDGDTEDGDDDKGSKDDDDEGSNDDDDEGSNDDDDEASKDDDDEGSKDDDDEGSNDDDDEGSNDDDDEGSKDDDDDEGSKDDDEDGDKEGDDNDDGDADNAVGDDNDDQITEEEHLDEDFLMEEEEV